MDTPDEGGANVPADDAPQEQQQQQQRRTSTQSGRQASVQSASGRQASIQSSEQQRRASQASKNSNEGDEKAVKRASLTATSPTTKDAEEGSTTKEGGAVPVRVAPPPPPGKKKATEEASGEYASTAAEGSAGALQSEYGDPSQFYQGYGGEAYGAVGYDPAQYGAQAYDYSAYAAASYDQSAVAPGYDQTAYGAYSSTTGYDPSAYTAAYGAGYDPQQYYQGYGDYGASASSTDPQQPQAYAYNESTQAAYTYDPATGQYAYDYSHQEQQQAYDYGGYDPSTYNAGYDQYGLQTTVVGADDTDTSASVSPRPDVSPSIPATDETANKAAAGDQVENADQAAAAATASSTAHYDYQQYEHYDYATQAGGEHYSATYQATVSTDYSGAGGQTAAAVTVQEPDAFDTSAYGVESQPATTDYSMYGSQVVEPSVDQQQHTDSSTGLQPTSFAAPLLPPQRPRTPDPFSWETQERNYEETGTALPPPRPPPMVKTPEPESATPSDGTETGESKGAPPPRPPASPAKQPPRPPPPPASPNRQMPPPPPPPPPKQAAKQEEPKKTTEEEDPWARFKQMSDQVSNVVKSTEQQLKNLGETTVAKDVKDESYLAQIGGTQSTELTSAQKQILKMQEEQKKAKADKKARKSASSKKNVVPQFDPKKEEDVEKAAAELVAKMAASRAHDLGGWKPPTDGKEKAETPTKEESSVSSPEEPEAPKSPEENKAQQRQEEESRRSSTKSEREAEKEEKSTEEEKEEPVAREGWADFNAVSAFNPTEVKAAIPSSESDFFSAHATPARIKVADAFGDEEGEVRDELEEQNGAPARAEKPAADPFAPTISAFDADPFDTRPIEEIMEEAKRRAELEASLHPGDRDDNLLHGSPATTRRSTSRASSPTSEGGSPVSAQPPMGFEDDFKADTSTPLYDEDDTVPLDDFIPKFTGDGWDLMIRHPLKKKSFMSERCWKPCFVRLRESDNMLRIFNSRNDDLPILEILLQGSYSLSECTLQAYDAYGKIHTIKLQHVLYKERVGIRAGQISRLVEGHITKYGLPLEHAAQINVLAKFASLDAKLLQTFVSAIEDVLFKCVTKRDTAPTYKQDEVQIHCYDEYTAKVDKLGFVSEQRARVRMFCLSFLTGSPYLEIGLNDRRREGKEIVRRKDILPMYTERWIRFEGLEFHNTVDQKMWDEEQVIRLQPPDSCFFEVMRFRIRPPRNREKPLSVKSMMKIAGSKVEIRIDVMAAAQHQMAKGTVESTRSIPCEDIQIRFPIPDAWIYIFREERTWGVGSVHSKTRRPGKVKNLKDRLMGAVQHTESTLIEVATGEAKYEHVYRALVWRIPRLPEKHHQAYKSHLLTCRFQLSSFDLMPEEFLPTCDVEFTMPLATISNAVVRSISVEQHEDSDRVEKFVRYVAKCHYDLDIDYVQCTNLDNDFETAPLELKKHEPAFKPDEVKAQYEGYGVKVDESKLREYEEQQQHHQQPPADPLQPAAAWGDASAGPQTVPSAAFDFDAYARQGNGGAFASGHALPQQQHRQNSSSEEEEEEENKKFPMIQIDMSNYGY